MTDYQNPIDLSRYHAETQRPCDTWEVHMVREVGAQPPRDGERWNATYTDPANQKVYGIVTWLAPQHLWLFVPDDYEQSQGNKPMYVAYQAFTRHGHCDTADAQYAQDKANGLLYTQFAH